MMMKENRPSNTLNNQIEKLEETVVHGRLTDQRHGGVAYYRMTEVLSQKVYLLKKTCKKTNVLFFAYVFSQTSCTDAKMLLKDVLKFCIINYSILLVYTARQTNPVDQQCKEHLVLLNGN